jgi:hypothetical protein
VSVSLLLPLLLLQAARFAARNIEGITCLAQDSAGTLRQTMCCLAVVVPPAAVTMPVQPLCIHSTRCCVCTYHGNSCRDHALLLLLVLLLALAAIGLVTATDHARVPDAGNVLWADKEGLLGRVPLSNAAQKEAEYVTEGSGISALAVQLDGSSCWAGLESGELLVCRWVAM